MKFNPKRAVACGDLAVSAGREQLSSKLAISTGDRPHFSSSRISSPSYAISSTPTALFGFKTPVFAYGLTLLGLFVFQLNLFGQALPAPKLRFGVQYPMDARHSPVKYDVAMSPQKGKPPTSGGVVSMLITLDKPVGYNVVALKPGKGWIEDANGRKIHEFNSTDWVMLDGASCFYSIGTLWMKDKDGNYIFQNGKYAFFVEGGEALYSREAPSNAPIPAGFTPGLVPVSIKGRQSVSLNIQNVGIHDPDAPYVTYDGAPTWYLMPPNLVSCGYSTRYAAYVLLEKIFDDGSLFSKFDDCCFGYLENNTGNIAYGTPFFTLLHTEDGQIVYAGMHAAGYYYPSYRVEVDNANVRRPVKYGRNGIDSAALGSRVTMSSYDKAKLSMNANGTFNVEIDLNLTVKDVKDAQDLSSLEVRFVHKKDVRMGVFASVISKGSYYVYNTELPENLALHKTPRVNFVRLKGLKIPKDVSLDDVGVILMAKDNLIYPNEKGGRRVKPLGLSVKMKQSLM